MSLSSFSPSERRVRAGDLGRVVLTTFLLMFLATRIVVILIMQQRVHDIYARVGGTYLHHPNYGILLLAGAGALLLFGRPTGRRLRNTAILYGIGLALTFDEIGMWLYLGGSYWHRASFDAVVVVAVLLGLLVMTPMPMRFRAQHWVISLILIGLVLLFAILLYQSVKSFGRRESARPQEVEARSPT